MHDRFGSLLRLWAIAAHMGDTSTSFRNCKTRGAAAKSAALFELGVWIPARERAKGYEFRSPQPPGARPQN